MGPVANKLPPFVNRSSGGPRLGGARCLLAKGQAVRGEMLWFNEEKDHGFIMTDEGERLAVPGDGFATGERPEGRCAHRVVTFVIDGTNGSRQARDVAFVPDAVAHRARMRGRGARG